MDRGSSISGALYKVFVYENVQIIGNSSSLTIEGKYFIIELRYIFEWCYLVVIIMGYL